MRAVASRCGPKANGEVVLVDLPVFGHPLRLAWHKRRWECAGLGVVHRR